MQQHLLTLRYTGMLADHGAMSIGDADSVQAGAGRLLAASARYYLYGSVPVRLKGQSRDFIIIELPAEKGSAIRSYAVMIFGGIASNAAYGMMADGISLKSVLIFASASAATILAERRQWKVEIAEVMRNNKTSQPKQQSRIEPTLPWPDRRGDGPSHESMLIDHTVRAFESLARPINYTGATGVQVSLDGEHLLDIRTLAGERAVTMRDREIADAISRLRRSPR